MIAKRSILVAHKKHRFKMLQPAPTREATRSWVGAIYEDKQRRRLVLAVILLLTAITAVLVRDYQSSLRNNNSETAAADSGQPAYSPSAAGPPPVIPTAETKTPVAANDSPAVPSRASSGHVNRTSRHLATNSTKRQNSSSSATASTTHATWGPATVAAQRDQVQSRQPAPSYPLLTQASAVQGSVLLQALIGADGAVQEMRVISGPTILVSAARQAVQQWRFKPYLVDGKPVETYARVTVNFTIDVSNTEARYHVNSVTSSGAL
jgi:TonB family protein